MNAISWSIVLHALAARENLSSEQMRWVMEEIMQGRAGEAEAAAFLMGMRSKGESAAEIADAARVLRAHMLAWTPSRAPVLDTCGTGGDGSATFNVSTATALVVAGAGVPVVKHGNRSVSSKSGSADVLAVLGLSLEDGVAEAQAALDRAGLAFCFAPKFHPALRHVAALRKRLGIPTLFNCLGPLANPAGAARQLLGVGRRGLLDLLAQALAMIGTEHALIVHGADGLDEVTLSGITHVREVTCGAIHSWEWRPEDFGLAPVALSEVQVNDANESAQRVLEVLDGKEGAALRLVLANAAAALRAAERVTTLREGVDAARHAIQSGNARAVLEKLRAR
jgi:anthranilate phosphoribosyltransferase